LYGFGFVTDVTTSALPPGYRDVLGVAAPKVTLAALPDEALPEPEAPDVQKA
jgi:hypothetical protein